MFKTSLVVAFFTAIGLPYAYCLSMIDAKKNSVIGVEAFVSDINNNEGDFRIKNRMALMALLDEFIKHKEEFDVFKTLIQLLKGSVESLEVDYENFKNVDYAALLSAFAALKIDYELLKADYSVIARDYADFKANIIPSAYHEKYM